MTILIVVALVLMGICAFKESKTTGLYRAFGVYGRISAYFCLFVPIGLIMAIVSVVNGDVMTALVCLVVMVIGIFCFWNANRKCPDFLKRKLIISMIISGLGVAMKTALFFIGAVWTIWGPQEVVDENGETLYVYDGKVYTSGGTYVGEASADRKSYVKIKN